MPGHSRSGFREEWPAVPSRSEPRHLLHAARRAEAIEALAGAEGMSRDDAPFRREHSLEAELPFLQQTLRPGWRLVPVLLGARSTADDLERAFRMPVRRRRPWFDYEATDQAFLIATNG